MKHLCCKQNQCSPETCANLPAGRTCGDCVHAKACARGKKEHDAQTACDWFPRRFKGVRADGIGAAVKYLVAHGCAVFIQVSKSRKPESCPSVCPACGQPVPAADDVSELAALDGLKNRGVITAEQAEEARRRIAEGGAA